MYILKSTKDGQLYIGSTSDLNKRVKEHSAGKVSSTKSRLPLRLVYFEGYRVESEARHREHNLKLRARALRQLLNRIKLSAELQNSFGVGVDKKQLDELGLTLSKDKSPKR